MKNYVIALIFGGSIIVSAFFVSDAVKNRNNNIKSISVTGLGSTNFTSDLIVWNSSFSKKNNDLKAAYTALEKDREAIRNYLLSKGVKENEIIFQAISLQKDFDYTFDQYNNIRSQIFNGYTLLQNVQVESNEVEKIEQVSREVSELINQGVELYSNAPEYYYTKLSELKLQMIAEATKDAKMRAEKIAENAGAHLGKLKKSDLGVFQIIAQNSSEDYSWGGSFNTHSKRKTATVTIKLIYGID